MILGEFPGFKASLRTNTGLHHAGWLKFRQKPHSITGLKGRIWSLKQTQSGKGDKKSQKGKKSEGEPQILCINIASVSEWCRLQVAQLRLKELNEVFSCPLPQGRQSLQLEFKQVNCLL